MVSELASCPVLVSLGGLWFPGVFPGTLQLPQRVAKTVLTMREPFDVSGQLRVSSPGAFLEPPKRTLVGDLLAATFSEHLNNHTPQTAFRIQTERRSSTWTLFGCFWVGPKLCPHVRNLLRPLQAEKRGVLICYG